PGCHHPQQRLDEALPQSGRCVGGADRGNRQVWQTVTRQAHESIFRRVGPSWRTEIDGVVHVVHGTFPPQMSRSVWEQDGVCTLVLSDTAVRLTRTRCRANAAGPSGTSSWSSPGSGVEDGSVRLSTSSVCVSGAHGAERTQQSHKELLH